jgi:hypothetical protein
MILLAHIFRYNVTIRVVVKEPMQVKTYTWCLKVPPRCTKFKVEMRDRFKIQVSILQDRHIHPETEGPSSTIRPSEHNKLLMQT